MKIDELLSKPMPLLEGENLEIYSAILPLLLINEDGDGSGPALPTPPETQAGPGFVNYPPYGGGWYGFGPLRPNTRNWINQLYSTLRNLAIANNINKRLAELGIKGEAAKRVKLAAKVAAKHVKLLLSNPGATAYTIPVWTTVAPKATKIKMWNEAFASEFEKQLSTSLLEQSVRENALQIAATYLNTKATSMVLVSGKLADQVAEMGKQVNRKLIQAAGGTWTVILYQYAKHEYVRIESPNKQHQLFKAARDEL